MGKKNDTLVIKAGKPITITADSRKAASDQLNALREKAEKEGLVQAPGGFIEHREGEFFAVITFVENKL